MSRIAASTETWNSTRAEPASSEPVTLVFEIPADLGNAEVALVVVTDEDYDSDRIPITIAELPPCCGE